MSLTIANGAYAEDSIMRAKVIYQCQLCGMRQDLRVIEVTTTLNEALISIGDANLPHACNATQYGVAKVIGLERVE